MQHNYLCKAITSVAGENTPLLREKQGSDFGYRKKWGFPGGKPRLQMRK